MRRFDRLEFDENKKGLRGDLDLPSPAPAEAKQQQKQQGASGQFLAAEHDEAHWINQAMEERRKGMHEAALRYYSRALELDKSLVSGWVGQVRMLIAMGEYPEAELWARKALELFKNNPELLAGRGQALVRTGDMKNAQACCDAAISQQGMASYPWIARGELMLARKESTDEYCFDKAAQVDGDWLALLEIGDIYLHYSKPTKALKRVRGAVERAPDHAYCWFCQGQCEQALGLHKAAEKSYRTCLQLVPNHLGARNALHELELNRPVVRGFFRRMFGRG